jgi:hypothetical protein
MMPACRAPSYPHLLCGYLQTKKEAHSRVCRGESGWRCARTLRHDQLSWEQETSAAVDSASKWVETYDRTLRKWMEKIVRCCAARPQDGDRSSAPVAVIIGLKGSRLRSWISAAISLTMRSKPLHADRMRSRQITSAPVSMRDHRRQGSGGCTGRHADRS